MRVLLALNVAGQQLSENTETQWSLCCMDGLSLRQKSRSTLQSVIRFCLVVLSDYEKACASKRESAFWGLEYTCDLTEPSASPLMRQPILQLSKQRLREIGS